MSEARDRETARKYCVAKVGTLHGRRHTINKCEHCAAITRAISAAKEGGRRKGREDAFVAVNRRWHEGETVTAHRVLSLLSALVSRPTTDPEGE